MPHAQLHSEHALAGRLRTMWRRMSSCSLNITRERVGSGVFRHLGNASLAACTASLNSAGVVSGRRETTSCVACKTIASTVQALIAKKLIQCESDNMNGTPFTGFVTSTHSVARDSRNSPLMSSFTDGCKQYNQHCYN